MSGFPTRITRATLGPKLENRFRVIDPRKEVGADPLNLAWWTVGAAGLMLPMVWFVCTQTGTADPVVVAHSESFNPNANVVGAEPVMDRTSAGVYPFAYNATYLDETEQAFPLVLWGGDARPGVSAFRHGQVEIAGDAHSGTVRFWSDGGATPADCAKFFVAIW